MLELKVFSNFGIQGRRVPEFGLSSPGGVQGATVQQMAQSLGFMAILGATKGATRVQRGCNISGSGGWVMPSWRASAFFVETNGDAFGADEDGVELEIELVDGEAGLYGGELGEHGSLFCNFGVNWVFLV